MTSLSETYNGGPLGAIWDWRQLIVAVSLFTAGAIMLVVGIVAATTEVFVSLADITITQSWEYAGILAGLGGPMVMMGIYGVLPASRRQRFGAIIGFSIVAVGVLMFYMYFPHQWHGDPTDYTLRVVAVYFLGTIITMSYLFSAVANFKERNNPGGTVTLRLEVDGETQEVEVSRDQLDESGGSVGLLGGTPNNHVETQTAKLDEHRSDE